MRLDPSATCYKSKTLDRWSVPEFSAFGKWVREGQEFKAIFAYKLSWRSA